MLSPGGKHPIGLKTTLRRQVINHYPYVRLATVEQPRTQTTHPPGRVYTCDKALPGGLLVAGGAIDLTSKE